MFEGDFLRSKLSRDIHSLKMAVQAQKQRKEQINKTIFDLELRIQYLQNIKDKT